MKNVLVLINHNAGRKKAIKYKKKVLDFLLQNGVNFKFVNIDEFSNVDKTLFDTILILGGDGTINKVLPYLEDKTLGIIPTGTANLLASKLSISNLSQALETIKNNKIDKIDIIKINNKPCILRFGMGYDADIIGKTPQSLKNKFGYFAYFIAGIIFALSLKIKEYEITIDNQKRIIKSSCIIVANAANMYRNFVSIGKDCSLNDSIFEVFILKTKNPFLFLIEFIKILFNFKITNSIAEYLKCNNLKIKNSYALCHIDGEKTKITENIDICLEKRKITVFKNC